MRHLYRPHALAAAVLMVAVTLLALAPTRQAEAATATKSCTPVGPNLVTCAFTVVPGVPTNGSWLVQMVAPNAGTLTGTPTIGSASGCTAAIAPGGSLISNPQGVSDYDVAVSGCGAGAVVTILETLNVTETGVICQRVWVNTSSPFAQACGNVTYTPPSPPASANSKACTPTSVPNEYACLFTIAPAYPIGGNNIIHVNEPPGPPMSGPGTITSTPVVSGSTGCSSPIGAVSMTGANMYQAPVGAGAGCSGAWSVTFSELITVTASGQICQSFYIVAAAPPETACASVTYTAPAGGGSSSGSGSPGSGSGSPGGAGSPGNPPAGGKPGFVAAPNFGAGASAMVIFSGGTVDDLEAATAAAGGSGVWVQDASGAFQLLIANGPAFLKAAFAAKFPSGFPGVSSVTVTRGG